MERNWRRPEGELDLIALGEDGTCVFCEVRSRTGETSGEALEAVGPRKQARVIRTARLYLAEGGVPAATSYRFDVVAVTFYEDERCPPRLIHVARAFETA